MRTSVLAHEQFHAMVDNLRSLPKPGKDATEKLNVLRKMEENVESMSPEDRYASARFLTEFLVPERFLRVDKTFDPALEQVLQFVKDSPEEYLAYYSQMLGMSLATNKSARSKIQEMKGYVSAEEAAFVQGFFKDLAEVGSALEAFGGNQLGSLVNDFKQLARTPKQLKDAQRQLLKLNNYLDPQEAVGKFGDAESLAFDTSDFTSEKGVKTIRAAVKQLKEQLKSDFSSVSRPVGEKVPLMVRLFGNPMQFALSLKDRLPVVADIVGNVYDKRSRADSALTSQNRVFLTENFRGALTTIEGFSNKKLTPEQRQLKTAMGLVAKNPTAERAFSEIALQHNSEFREVPIEDVVSKSFKKLKQEDKDNVWRLIQATKTMNQLAAQNIIKHGQRQAAMVTSKILMLRNPEMSWQDALRAGLSGQETATKVFTQLPATPKTIMRGHIMEYKDNIGQTQYVELPGSRAEQKQLKQQLMSQGIDGRTIKVRGGLDVTDKKHQQLKALHEQAVGNFALQLEAAGVDAGLSATIARTYANHAKLERILRRPYFFSERRVGDFIIKYQRAGEEGTEAAATKQEADEIIKRLRQDEDVDQTSINGFKKSRQQKADEINYLNPTAVRVFGELEREAYETAKTIAGKEKADVVFPDYTPGEATLNKWLNQRTRSFFTSSSAETGP